jgi:hypothetical protein
MALRRRFEMVENIIKNTADELRATQQTSLKQCFQKWKKWLDLCIAAQGNYFQVEKWN